MMKRLNQKEKVKLKGGEGIETKLGYCDSDLRSFVYE